MKKRRIFALTLALLMLLAACSKTEPQEPTPPENGGTETPADGGQTTAPSGGTEPEPSPKESAPISWSMRTETEEIKTEDGAELLNIRISVPQGAGELVDKYYDGKIAEQLAYMRSLEPDAREQYERIKESGDGEWVWTAYELDADFSVQRNDGEIFSVLRTSLEYTGGTHPNYVLAAETFRTADGALVTLDYLFSVPREEYMERIRTMVLAEMDKRTEEEGMELYYDDARENLMESFNAGNFFLTDDALAVFWQTYDLAPHAVGVQIFNLPLSELADVISMIDVEPQTEGGIRWGGRTVRDELKSEDGATLVTVCICVPRGAGELMDRYYDDRIEELRAFADELKEDALIMGYDSSMRPYSLNTEFSVERNDEKVFSVLRTVIHDIGGAHPHWNLTGETFRTRDGSIITLDELFIIPREEYLALIREAVLAEMDRQTEEIGSDFYFDGAREYLMDIFDERNFFLTDDVLTVFWQRYDLMAGIGGPRFFDLPLAELADVISLQ
ncbi:MAG: DUF3298 domain-containing protein [Clostridia bacterium]|nr:DUF3298 domain-containing protein [Clostridia bacterium]